MSVRVTASQHHGLVLFYSLPSAIVERNVNNTIHDYTT